MVGLLETVFHNQMQVVPLVEDLALDVGVVLLELADLLVLLGDELLIHRGDLDEDLVIQQVEVRCEELGRLAVFEPDREAARLVFPRDTIEVEEESELPLTVVSEIDLVGSWGFGVQGAPNSTTPASSSCSGNN
jgi:hypothetical protein